MAQPNTNTPYDSPPKVKIFEDATTSGSYRDSPCSDAETLNSISEVVLTETEKKCRDNNLEYPSA